MLRIFPLLTFTGLCIFASTFTAIAQPAPATDEASTLHGQAKKLWEDEQWLDAEKAFLGALKVYERQMATKHQNDALLLRWCQCRHELVEAQLTMQKLPQAKALAAATIAYLKQVIPLRPKEPAFRFELAKTHMALSNGYQQLRLHADADTRQREAINLLKKLVEDHPARADYRLELSKWQRCRVRFLTDFAKSQEAETLYREELSLAQKLVADAPKSPECLMELALIQNIFGYQVRESGRFVESLEMLRGAIRVLTKLEADYPDQPQFWSLLPILQQNLAQSLSYSGNVNVAELNQAKTEAQRVEAKLAKIPEPAKKWARDTDKIESSLRTRDLECLGTQQQELDNLLDQTAKGAAAHPKASFLQAKLAALKNARAQQLIPRGRVDEARAESQEALAILEKLNVQAPGIPANRQLQAEAYLGLGGAFMSEGKRADADKHFRQAFALLEKLAADYPEAPHFRYRIHQNLTSIVAALLAQNQVKDALAYLKESQVVMTKLTSDYPACIPYRRLDAMVHAKLAGLLQAQQAFPEAEAELREGIRLWSKLSADFPQATDYRKSWAKDCGVLGQFLLKREKFQESVDAFSEMVRLTQKLRDEHPREPEFHTALAISHLWLAQVYEKQDRRVEAIEDDTKAIALWETAWQLNPRQRNWLTELRASVQHRGYLQLKLSKQVEYLSDLQRAKEIDEMLEAPLFRLYRIEERALKGNTTLAMKEADDLLQNVDLTDAEWHRLAVFFIDQSAKATDVGDKEALATRSLAALRHAIDLGYDRMRLRADARWLPIVAREDFRRLMQGK